jgi:hypothetical protein
MLRTADEEFNLLRTLGVSEQCFDFLPALLAPYPDDRPSSQMALEHGWLVESAGDVQEK